VKGQERALKILSGFRCSGKIPSALLFHGPPGVGKRTLALEWAAAIVCERPGEEGAACGACRGCEAAGRGAHPDLRLVGAAYQAALLGEEPETQRALKVDTIRHLRREMETTSLWGGWKISILEDAQTLESASANALLKILEEPKPRTLWILLAVSPESLPKTIVSRCARVPFSALRAGDVEEILAARGVPAPKARAIARLSGGSAGRAVEMWEEAADGEEEAPAKGDPLAPFSLAESLPRELPLARRKAERIIALEIEKLRLDVIERRVPFSKAGPALRELRDLLRAVGSNADPRAAVVLSRIALEVLSS
jgi:DNA polymerase-3 subunit delta'